jgi:hypothetical protein
MEFLDGLVEGGAVDDGVMRRQRDAEDVGVAVLSRAGQVVIDGIEAQVERLVRRPASRLGCGW